ncbi:MAG: SDR family oxidoreductase [Actinomycetota bacterium]|nr:MAG: SDR family oxidoreductase [Actinomycetota bacterium]
MESLFDLRGHHALITGGNSGIGLGMAEGLARHGAAVAIWGTSPQKNAAAVTHLSALGGEAWAAECDVGDEQQVEDAFAATLDALGRIDSVFVNAGVGGRASSFVGMSADEWRRVLRVNLDGAFFTARAACRHMVERGGGGSLVFTTSGSAYFGQQRGQHYGASKAGLIAMAKAIAVEHARDGIRANAVLPGWTESEMTAPAFAWDTFVDKVGGRIPLRRWGRPDDFAGIAVYLASSASSYHTGDVITLDGGYHSF